MILRVRLLLMETSLITSRKNVLFFQVKRYERIKKAQASNITVLAFLGVRLRNSKTVIFVTGKNQMILQADKCLLKISCFQIMEYKLRDVIRSNDRNNNNKNNNNNSIVLTT